MVTNNNMVSEVRIDLIENRDPDNRVLAYVEAVLYGAWLIKDMKLISGNQGWFLSMPNKRMRDRCPRCAHKNDLQAHYCSSCGLRLDERRALRDPDNWQRLYRDQFHPITSQARAVLTSAVVTAYQEELELSKRPGYWEGRLLNDYNGDLEEVG